MSDAANKNTKVIVAVGAALLAGAGVALLRRYVKVPTASQPTSKTTLTYWDGHGNAEAIRFMLAACGEEWIDHVAGQGPEVHHLSNKEQYLRLMDAGLLAFDQVPLSTI